MTRKAQLIQRTEEDITFYANRLEDVTLQEDIAKAEVEIAKAKLSTIRKEKRIIKKDIKEHNEVLESLNT